MTTRRYPIVLSASELAWAQRVGLLRSEGAKKDGKNEAHGHSADFDLADHILGCCGELAWCKFLGVLWAALVGTYHECADIIDCLHIRTGSHLNDPLIHRPCDKQGDYWGLAVGCGRVFFICGYALGYEVRALGTWTNFNKPDRPLVCAVEQELLYDAAELKAYPLWLLPIPPCIECKELDDGPNAPFQTKVASVLVSS